MAWDAARRSSDRQRHAGQPLQLVEGEAVDDLEHREAVAA